MDQYKKRAKTGWGCGKKYKKDSNSQERIYAKQDLRRKLDEHEQGDDFRYRHISKRNKNEKVSLDSLIDHYERKSIIYKRNGWLLDYYEKRLNSLRHRRKQLQVKLCG